MVWLWHFELALTAHLISCYNTASFVVFLWFVSPLLSVRITMDSLD